MPASSQAARSIVFSSRNCSIRGTSERSQYSFALARKAWWSSLKMIRSIAVLPGSELCLIRLRVAKRLLSFANLVQGVNVSAVTNPLEWEHVQPAAARRLLTGAIDAFAERGFQATTTRDIASRAGMSPAALYVHYPSKERLLFEISLYGHHAALAILQSADERRLPRPIACARWSPPSPPGTPSTTRSRASSSTSWPPSAPNTSPRSPRSAAPSPP